MNLSTESVALLIVIHGLPVVVTLILAAVPTSVQLLAERAGSSTMLAATTTGPRKEEAAFRWLPSLFLWLGLIPIQLASLHAVRFGAGISLYVFVTFAGSVLVGSVLLSLIVERNLLGRGRLWDQRYVIPGKDPPHRVLWVLMQAILVDLLTDKRMMLLVVAVCASELALVTFLALTIRPAFASIVSACGVVFAFSVVAWLFFQARIFGKVHQRDPLSEFHGVDYNTYTSSIVWKGLTWGLPFALFLLLGAGSAITPLVFGVGGPAVILVGLVASPVGLALSYLCTSILHRHSNVVAEGIRERIDPLKVLEARVNEPSKGEFMSDVNFLASYAHPTEAFNPVVRTNSVSGFPSFGLDNVYLLTGKSVDDWEAANHARDELRAKGFRDSLKLQIAKSLIELLDNKRKFGDLPASMIPTYFSRRVSQLRKLDPYDGRSQALEFIFELSGEKLPRR